MAAGPAASADHDPDDPQIWVAGMHACLPAMSSMNLPGVSQLWLKMLHVPAPAAVWGLLSPAFSLNSMPRPGCQLLDECLLGPTLAMYLLTRVPPCEWWTPQDSKSKSHTTGDAVSQQIR